MSQPSIFDVLERVTQQIPGCLMTSVVDLDSGISLATVGASGSMTSAEADAYHSDLYRLIERSMAMLESHQPVEGLVLMGRSATFVSAPLGDSGHFWHVATEVDTTIGFTQALMRKYQADVTQSLGQLL